MTKFDSLNLTAPHTMREIGQPEYETSAQGDRDMKKKDKDAIKALIGAIEDGGTGNISIAAWIARDSIRVPFGYSIKTVLSNVSVAISFQNANLTDCEWRLHSSGYAYIVGPDGLIKASAHNDRPATALVVATLRAMLATKE